MNHNTSSASTTTVYEGHTCIASSTVAASEMGTQESDTEAPGGLGPNSDELQPGRQGRSSDVQLSSWLGGAFLPWELLPFAFGWALGGCRACLEPAAAAARLRMQSVMLIGRSQ